FRLPPRTHHPRLGDDLPRPGGRAAHRAYPPASARRLLAGGAETWPAGKAVRGAARFQAGRTAARASNRDRRLAGLAVLADGLPAIRRAGLRRSPAPGHLALPAARWLTPGGAKGTRTPDPLLAKQVLFQLSYSPSTATAPRIPARLAGLPGLNSD